MTHAKLLWSDIEQTAKSRPREYMDQIIDAIERRDGPYAYLNRHKYEAMRAKYSPRHDSELRGPGTELKKLLAGWPFYIRLKKWCRCDARAMAMNQQGCDWCEQNLPTIVGWLQEEHSRQGVAIPFIYPAVEQLVLLAIRRARKKGNK